MSPKSAKFPSMDTEDSHVGGGYPLYYRLAAATSVLEKAYSPVGSSLYSMTNEAGKVWRRVVGGKFIHVSARCHICS
jgi:hypothetical protein